MSEIRGVNRAVYFLAYGPDGTRHIGRTDTNQLTSTGQPSLIFSDDPYDFLEQTTGIPMVGHYQHLPNEGEWVTQGAIYEYNDDLIIARQSHVRTADDPSTIPALFIAYIAESNPA